MNIIVAGTRDFADRDLVFRTLDRLTAKVKKIVVYSGHSGKVDRAAEDWAWKRGHVCKVFHAQWNEHGKAAGPIRNREMLDADANALIALWDGKSKGTADMILQARRRGITVKVVRIDKVKR